MLHLQRNYPCAHTLVKNKLSQEIHLECDEAEKLCLYSLCISCRTLLAKSEPLGPTSVCISQPHIPPFAKCYLYIWGVGCSVRSELVPAFQASAFSNCKTEYLEKGKVQRTFAARNVLQGVPYPIAHELSDLYLQMAGKQKQVWMKGILPATWLTSLVSRSWFLTSLGPPQGCQSSGGLEGMQSTNSAFPAAGRLHPLLPSVAI